MRRRDDLAIHNERVKLAVTILNAIAIAFFGLGVARPLIDGDVPITLLISVHFVVAVAAVRVAYIVLGQLKTDEPEKEKDR